MLASDWMKKARDMSADEARKDSGHLAGVLRRQLLQPVSVEFYQRALCAQHHDHSQPTVIECQSQQSAIRLSHLLEPGTVPDDRTHLAPSLRLGRANA